MLAGRAVMINWSDVAPEHRPAYYEWHCREHMVGRLAIPGYRRGRRYLAARAQRDFLVLYEVDDLAVVTGADYLAKANQPTPLTQRTTPFIKNAVRGLARVKASFGTAAGGCALTLRFDPRPGGEQELESFLTQGALPRAAARPDVVGPHQNVAHLPRHAPHRHPLIDLQAQPRDVGFIHQDDVAPLLAAVDVLLLVDHGVELALRAHRHQPQLAVAARRQRVDGEAGLARGRAGGVARGFGRHARRA